MLLTQELVAGVDLWINTPRRPWEACGTSGMKVLANGGLNVSELDGWWAEAYAPEIGWAFGDGRDRGEDPDWDAAEADRLYELLEGEIIPDFYNRQEGIPRQWVGRIRESMARLTPAFSANRTVRQYTEEQYLPLAAAYRVRAREKGKAAVDLIEWQRQTAGRWPAVHFGPVAIFTQDGQHRFRVQVMLGSIPLSDVQVEIYADTPDHAAPFRAPLALAESTSTPGTYWFAGSVPADRPTGDYTPRIIPQRDGAFLPMEGAWIAWQK
jgi:starch phosphorylase